MQCTYASRFALISVNRPRAASDNHSATPFFGDQAIEPENSRSEELMLKFRKALMALSALALAFASSSVAQAAEKKDMGLYVNLATKDTSKPAMHSPMRSSSTSAVTRWLSS
jgi:hypothetical protein